MMIKVDVNGIIKLWTHTKKCNQILEGYKQLEWAKVETAEMDEEINKRLRKELNDLRNIDKKSTAYTGIQKYLKNCADFVPTVGELKDPSIQTADMRHWKRVQEITKSNFEINDQTTLAVVWDLNLFNFKDDIEETT
jgi:dynein heavy chain